MDPQAILQRVEDAMNPRRVFGDPVQVDGVTVLPVATVGGGGGGGQKGDEGAGVGFGLGAQPAGVFVIRDGDAKWRPALNLNRVILGGQIVGLAAILTFGGLMRYWLRHRTETSRANRLQPAL
jgi:uncharacterized spore protein YtfJ